MSAVDCSSFYGLHTCVTAGCHGGALIDYASLVSCWLDPSPWWTLGLLGAWTCLLLVFMADTVMNYGADAAAVVVELVTPTREMAAVALLAMAAAGPDAVAVVAAVRAGHSAMGALPPPLPRLLRVVCCVWAVIRNRATTCGGPVHVRVCAGIGIALGACVLSLSASLCLVSRCANGGGGGGGGGGGSVSGGGGSSGGGGDGADFRSNPFALMRHVWAVGGVRPHARARHGALYPPSSFNDACGCRLRSRW
jgi:hypothetical protein